MASREKTPFTGEHFMRFCQRMIGQPFWYGACCEKASETLLWQKSAQYPAQYESQRMEKYLRDIAAGAVVADCIGAAKGYAWTDGGESILAAIGTKERFSLRPGSHGCPDKSADAMFHYAQRIGMAHGFLDTLPEIPGVALRKPGHTAYYLGQGKAIEWRGFHLGCVLSPIAGRGFTHWYMLPFLRYAD